MKTQFVARHWWALALRGLFAVVFGLMMFAWPLVSFAVLVMMFGAYAMADGLLAILAAEKVPAASGRWWALLVGGVLGFAVGVLTFIWPGITALVLLYLIAFRAILLGVFELLAAVRLRREITGEWLLATVGVISLLFGLTLLVYPAAGALAVVWLVGVYALLAGVTLLTLAFRLLGRAKAGRRGVLGTA